MLILNMNNPGIKTVVSHNPENKSYDVVGDLPFVERVIAQVPYTIVDGFPIITTNNKRKAKMYAGFISECFNNHHRIPVFNITSN